MTDARRQEELRHCLTVVSGYLGLALEDRAGGSPPPVEHWTWLTRARDAAVHAAALLEASDLPVPPPQAA